MYNFRPVTDSKGVVDPRYLAADQEMHYHWSNSGLIMVTPASAKAEAIAPELTDWLKRYKYPLQLEILSNRFLVIYLQTKTKPVFSNRDVRNGEAAINALTPHATVDPINFEYVDPGAVLYPTYTRALILDTQLGKWGTCDVSCKLLTSMTPYNQLGYNLSKNYQSTSDQLDDDLRELAISLADGYTYVANMFPVDSYVLFGHYATHRERTTKLVEITTEYVNYPDAVIEIEHSLDGAKVDFDNLTSYAQTELVSKQGFNLAAKWYNVLIKGHYHLKRLLIKGYTYGRR